VFYILLNHRCSEIITRRDETRVQKLRGIPFVMATKKYDDEVSDDSGGDFDDEENPTNKIEVPG